MIIPNAKRHSNNTKTDQLPISEVITGLPRPYHNRGLKSYFGFCVRAENYLVLIYGSKLSWFLAWGSKLIRCLCANRKRLVLLWGSMDFVFCARGQNWLGLCMSAENHLVVVWASNLASFFYGGSSWLDFIVQCGGSNLTWFQSRYRNWHGFDVGVKNHLF